MRWPLRPRLRAGPRKIEAAIQASQPGSTALNLDQALAFARHVQAQEGRRAGRNRLHRRRPHGGARPGRSRAAPRNLRVLLVPDAIENCGLRKVGMRRSATEPDLWEIYVSAHNYGDARRAPSPCCSITARPTPRRARRRVPQRWLLPPGGDAEASFQYRTAAAGILGVKMLPHDAFPADDQAELELPCAAASLRHGLFGRARSAAAGRSPPRRASPPSTASPRSTGRTTRAW